MAKNKEIVIGVIIAAVFLFSFVFVSMMFMGVFSQDSDFEFTGTGGNVGVIEVSGIIDEEVGRKAIRQMEKWEDNSAIKAVVVHVNSPGGGVAISQEVYDEIKRLRDTKPVVCALASIAASGGYYIACGADRIVANPGTLTGSIGVILQFHTFVGLMDKVGVELETIKSGELKDVGNYSRPMTQKEDLMLRSVVMDTYEQFVEVVAAGRGLEKDQVYPLADGSIFTGLQAYNLQLVDELGGLYEAVNLAGEMADIEGDIKIVRPYERKSTSIFDLIENVAGIGDFIENKVENSLVGPQLMYLYQ